MKAVIFLFSIPLIFLYGCYPTTQITGSWKNPKQAERNYHSIFIAALTGNTIAKSTLENDLETALTKYGVTISKSIDAFPPSFEKDSIPRSELMKKVRKNGNEAILTVSMLKKETESRYVGGPYTPMTWGYYGSFWGYYNYWYPHTYADSYYTKESIYYLETNLYDATTESLVWSAQSKTYSYEGLVEFSKEFSNVVVEQMKKEGIVKTGLAQGK